ncbi:MAG: phosphotransferase [Lachnospiraceae bacterium]|nr:phosphotransferase [Lachnospiraceae bacterium]
MNDRAVSLLDQYDVEVYRTRKGRGAILCDTTRGSLVFKEYTGNTEKVLLQDKLLKQIEQMGNVLVEQIIPNKEGKLLVKDHDGVSYLLKTNFEGQECNVRDKEECIKAVKLLGELHACMELPALMCEGVTRYSQDREYEKHNREMKKAKHYLWKKRRKTWFEFDLLHNIDYFLEQAIEVTKQWQDYKAAGNAAGGTYPLIFCHGDYQYHNILRKDNQWMIVNFDKYMLDNPIRDLYLFMRKLLEKSDWSVALGKELLQAYQSIRTISFYAWIDLYYRFAYPEKFWKIVNFYFNSGRSLIPERNQEKLEKLLTQEKQKQNFLNEVFREL